MLPIDHLDWNYADSSNAHPLYSDQALAGRTHDFKLFQDYGLGLNDLVTGCLVDSGYQGVAHFLSDIVVLLPFKSSKRKPVLNDESTQKLVVLGSSLTIKFDE